jgi:menaquinol-cytochrome c reductase iron-sulfur subunit
MICTMPPDVPQSAQHSGEPAVDSALPLRRPLFRALTGALGALAAAAAGVPVVGYLLAMRKTPVHWVPLGAVNDYTPGETRLETFANPLHQPWDGMVAQTGVFVRRLGVESGDAKFLVLAVNCAHLGCPVSWFPQSGLFMCPCHGGVYYETGERASGPPPRGLFQCEWRVRADRLEVQAPHYPTLQDTLREKT